VCGEAVELSNQDISQRILVWILSQKADIIQDEICWHDVSTNEMARLAQTVQ
jgi:hypothetical protein